jgi:hypothetical protein
VCLCVCMYIYILNVVYEEADTRPLPLNSLKEALKQS